MNIKKHIGRLTVKCFLIPHYAGQNRCRAYSSTKINVELKKTDMKDTLTISFLALILFSCSNDEIEPSAIDLEEAKSLQYISFNVGERTVNLTEFKDDAWPFHGGIIWTDSLEFDSNTEYPISRVIYASVPEEQVLNSHIETFGLEFNQIFSKSEIDMTSNKLLNNEKFKSDFIITGEQDINLSNFGFHQTYLIGTGQVNSRSLRVAKVESIQEHDNLILVTGEFSGGVGHDFIGDITNGMFKVIIEN